MTLIDGGKPHRGMIGQLIDSAFPSTRVYWRVKYFDATDAEAADPRPFMLVLLDRLALLDVAPRSFSTLATTTQAVST